VTDPGGPRRGRHSDGAAGAPAPYRGYGAGTPTGGYPPLRPSPGYPTDGPDSPTAGFRRKQDLLDRYPTETGPLVEPDWWSYGSSDHPNYPPRARYGDENRPLGAGAWGEHPSAPLPPRPPGVWDRLKPRELDPADDAQTLAQPALSAQGPRDPRDRPAVGSHRDDSVDPHEQHSDAPPVDPRAWEDQTGGLDVIGAHVEEDAPRRRGLFRRARPTRGAAAPSRHQADGRHRPGVPAGEPDHDEVHDGDVHYDDVHYQGADYGDVHDDDAHYEGAHHDVVHRRDARYQGAHYGDVRYDDVHDDGHDDDLYDADGHYADGHDLGHDDAYHEGAHYEDVHEDDLHPDEVVHVDGQAIPVAPYDPRSRRTRRRRRPVAVLISLVVLAGIVVGIVLGGQKLLAMIDPSSRDFSGQGTGTVQIRVHEGDTLSDIARTLVANDVIASARPFVNAAEAHPDATAVQPGVYSLRQQMSGQAALDMLLNPKARLLSRVTVPEGLTVAVTLTRLASSTGTPLAQLKAAAADTAALGLPAYAHGKLEGFLFPATYDFEPGTKPVDMLKQMVTRAGQALDKLQIPTAQRMVVLTKASIVQAEAGSTADMGKVARVLENRLADGMPLQLDTTVNYANGKAGVTTSPQDRRNPSPYNTYVHAGLPPGAISNPGEEALSAVLSPTPGNWRFFVVVNPATGDTRFAVTAAEHQQNVLLFQKWLREHPGG
jgi:uncharacterized YceG family protein